MMGRPQKDYHGTVAFEEFSPLRMARDMAQRCNDASKIMAYVNNYFGSQCITRERCEALIGANRTTYNVGEPSKRDDGSPWRPLGLVKPEKPVKVKAVRKSRAKPKRNRDYIFLPTTGANPFLSRPGRAMSIIASVGRDYGLTLGEMIGVGRSRQHAKARFICYRLLRELGLSTPHIGRILDRDHSTVVHGLARFGEELARDTFFARVYQRHVDLRGGATEALAA